MIKSFVITLKNNEKSELGADNLIKSSPIPIDIFSAIVPDQVDEIMSNYNLTWTWPWTEEKIDIKSGLKLHPYVTYDPHKRIACFLSHYILWKKCADLNEPMFIFEHDSIFTNKSLSVQDFIDSKYYIIGINNPHGATRRSIVYDNKLQSSLTEFARVPEIDDLTVPQGLAGNSAYFIKPEGAKKVLELVKQYGCWPNDAIMCRQLLPLLGATKTYYTGLQKLGSTTKS